MTKQERVWRCIKASEFPICPREIAAALGMSSEETRYALRELKRSHEFILDGKTRASTYLVPAGEVYKGDNRGKTAGSKASRRNWPSDKGRAAAKAKRNNEEEQWGGAHRVTRAPPTRLTDLDMCWANVVKATL